MNRFCTCEYWEEGMAQISAALTLERLHGGQYTAKPFKYCPWCGEELFERGASKHYLARGVVPWKEGDELPEDVIRRMRDA